MKKQEALELRRNVDQLKEGEKIDFDVYCFKILEVYRTLVSSAKEYVKTAFSACDLVI